MHGWKQTSPDARVAERLARTLDEKYASSAARQRAAEQLAALKPQAIRPLLSTLAEYAGRTHDANVSGSLVASIAAAGDKRALAQLDRIGILGQSAEARRQAREALKASGGRAVSVHTMPPVRGR